MHIYIYIYIYAVYCPRDRQLQQVGNYAMVIHLHDITRYCTPGIQSPTSAMRDAGVLAPNRTSEKTHKKKHADLTLTAV